jgi:hypothetical protein
VDRVIADILLREAQALIEGLAGQPSPPGPRRGDSW